MMRMRVPNPMYITGSFRGSFAKDHYPAARVFKHESPVVPIELSTSSAQTVTSVWRFFPSALERYMAVSAARMTASALS